MFVRYMNHLYGRGVHPSPICERRDVVSLRTIHIGAMDPIRDLYGDVCQIQVEDPGEYLDTVKNEKKQLAPFGTSHREI